VTIPELFPRAILAVLLCILPASAQAPQSDKTQSDRAGQSDKAAQSDKEQESLQEALGEAGNSPVDFIRALESHLAQFPDSPRRPELEAALAKTAIDLNDDKRIILYGEKAIGRSPRDPRMLQAVCAALLRTNSAEAAFKALGHAESLQRIYQNAAETDKKGASGPEQAKLKDQTDRGIASALLLQARAEGILTHLQRAVEDAEKSYALFPSVEAGREASKWLAAEGKTDEAIQYLANAFAIAGLNSADPAKAADRARLGELYRQWKGSDAGLGDMILQGYDRSAAQLAARREQIREIDPNAQVLDPLEFTLSGVDGEKFKLSSLLGKVVVLDFWATWCGPCRVQHPLYEEVKAKFKDNPGVVFLSIDSDEDHALVKPFLQAQKWSQKVYFEDGLSRLLQVSSIPSTIIFNQKGEVTSRMIGFLPERFVEMLTDRIDEALGKPAHPARATSQ
jgi:thiol-disulfide isomerase/thioredoxin